MSIWLMAIISGLLCTQFVNPFFVFRFFKGIFLCIRNKKEGNQNNINYRKLFDFGLNSNKVFVFMVTQGVFFMAGAVIFGLHYHYDTVDRTFTQMLTKWHTVGMLHILNAVAMINAECFKRWMAPKGFIAGIVICGASMITFSLALNIHTLAYDLSHPVVPLHETDVPVIDVSVMERLEHEESVQGYTLDEPIKRNGEVIIPLYKNDNVSTIGYVVIQDNKPVIVKKELKNTPYGYADGNINYIARDYLPTTIFFGDWSFQVAPNGDVYFARMYGDFVSLRAGRDIKGMLLINAENGKCLQYSLNDVPDWIDGISE